MTEMDAEVVRCNLYQLDLVQFNTKRGMIDRGLVISYAPEDDTCRLFRLDGTMVTKKADEIPVLERSSIHVGQFVVSATDAGGQIGVVTGVATDLHVAQIDDRGKVGKQILGVSTAGVRRVRELSLGDYVLSGPWLGRVVEVSVDVDVLFDDGAVCRVADAGPKVLKSASDKKVYHFPQTNVPFYPGGRVTSDSFEGSRWLNGHWKPDRKIGTVVNVEMAGVSVYWIASAQRGTKQQLVQESAPPTHQHPSSLTYFCSASDCRWALGDRCFLNDDVEQHHASSLQAHSAPLPTMTVANHNTTVDVLWQDGTRQYGARSTYLDPYGYPYELMMEHDFFPGQHVVDNAPSDAVDDAAGDDANGSTRRVGVVRSVDHKDHMVHLSWFKAASTRPGNEASSLEVECDDTVSAYDLVRDPDHYVVYGDVVVRLSTVTGSTPAAQQPQAATSTPADVPWVGRVVDLLDGHVQVKWSDGSTSMVLPHEISVANKESYMQLRDEMADWVEEDDVGAPQELDAANAVNDPHDSVDATNVKDGDGSVNELDGPAETRQNAEVSMHEDSDVGGAATEADLVDLVTRGDVSDDDSEEDYANDVEIKATGDGGPFKFPNFDVVKSPPDHYYLDTAHQGISSGNGSVHVKKVQKEWKILHDSLPGTIYVRAFEDRMDLVRVAMVGASGTPYQDGLFFFDMQMPQSYPAVPPEVYYHSFGFRLNPNLYTDGTVCLSLLNTFSGEGNEVWVPGTSSLLQVVVSIQALVLNSQPFYNEAGYERLIDRPEGHRHELPYNENALLLTLRTMIHLLRRPPQGFEGVVRDHFRRRGRYVLETCEAYLQGCVDAGHGSMELPCSAGFRTALANVMPKLTTAFAQIGAQGCDHCAATNH
ncbi:probable ubiquitin-conjugating enzyme E2 23 [Triticum aestivum]|uniref:probable ubiquitin-conjugating enzyme E2 23 n=1 Tax=Triticum aestivum TaxID=4565 RepID=UPI001D02D88E|nr:probable ubiquitin-conjugating enzyme E2 23 [Triticum aestivum]